MAKTAKDLGIENIYNSYVKMKEFKKEVNINDDAINELYKKNKKENDELVTIEKIEVRGLLTQIVTKLNEDIQQRQIHNGKVFPLIKEIFEFLKEKGIEVSDIDKTEIVSNGMIWDIEVKKTWETRGFQEAEQILRMQEQLKILQTNKNPDAATLNQINSLNFQIKGLINSKKEIDEQVAKANV